MSLASQPVGPARHPYVTAIAALCVAGLAAYVVAEIIGLHEVGHAFDHLRPLWLVPCFAVQGLSIPAYATAYRAVVARIGARRLGFWRTGQLVVTGFAPLSAAGGFASDERVLQRLGLDRELAMRVVLVLSGVELVGLVWIAFTAAVVAAVVDPALGGALTLPWLVLVPSGTVLAILIDRHEQTAAVVHARSFTRALVSSLDDVLALLRHGRRFVAGWAGITAYWLADMAALGFALRAFGQRPVPEAIVLAYATGYLVSRRTLPLGGAGFVEFVMTFSLYWVHVALAPALGAVVIYRALDLGLTAVRASVARLRLEASLRAAEPPDAARP